MLNVEEFFPTPRDIVRKMLADIKIDRIRTILEPSAGKGDIVDVIKEKIDALGRRYYGEAYKTDIDTIEKDANLRYILKGKGYRVVHEDFLAFETFKKYDLIIMNPPFSNGDKHLLKALEMQKDGGQVICLLNAETLKNPFSNQRKDLIRKLEDYNASIDYIKDGFTFAERKTDVEVALIKVSIPQAPKISGIITGLKNETALRQSPNCAGNQVTSADIAKSMVEKYNFEVKAGLRMINEYLGMKPYLAETLKDSKCSKYLLRLEVSGAANDNEMINTYIQQVRYKYWELLFVSDMFTSLFTSKLQKEYMKKISELQNYDFSLFNIEQVQLEIMKSMVHGVEETIIELFDEFSHKYHWFDESSKNIHYYNGWRTNKCWTINKKVIILLKAYDWSGHLSYDYNIKQKLMDIEKVFNYLDLGTTEPITLSSVLEEAQKKGITRKIDLKYFKVTFYKKGSCHIEFKNLDLLKKFNIYGSQRKGWLPPSYGKARYKDMDPEEQAVINSFEGEKEYEKVVLKKNYFITETVNLKLLA